MKCPILTTDHADFEQEAIRGLHCRNRDGLGDEGTGHDMIPMGLNSNSSGGGGGGGGGGDGGLSGFDGKGGQELEKMMKRLANLNE